MTPDASWCRGGGQAIATVTPGRAGDERASYEVPLGHSPSLEVGKQVRIVVGHGELLHLSHTVRPRGKNQRASLGPVVTTARPRIQEAPALEAEIDGPMVVAEDD